MVAISIFDTSNFIMSDPTKFDFVGSISEDMLLMVPMDYVLINKNLKKPTTGPRPMPENLRKALDEGNKP